MATLAPLMVLKPVESEASGLVMAVKAVLYAWFDPFMRIMAGVAIKLHRRVQARWKRHPRIHLLMAGKTNLPLRDQGGSAF